MFLNGFDKKFNKKIITKASTLILASFMVVKQPKMVNMINDIKRHQTLSFEIFFDFLMCYLLIKTIEEHHKLSFETTFSNVASFGVPPFAKKW